MPRLSKLKYFLIGVLVLTVAFVVYFPSYSRYRELKIEAEKLDLQVRDLQKKIQELQAEKELMRNDKSYLEAVIRKELGLVEPGEVVYEFGPNSARKPSPAVKPDQTQAVAVVSTRSIKQLKSRRSLGPPRAFDRLVDNP